MHLLLLGHDPSLTNCAVSPWKSIKCHPDASSEGENPNLVTAGSSAPASIKIRQIAVYRCWTAMWIAVHLSEDFQLMSTPNRHKQATAVTEWLQIIQKCNGYPSSSIQFMLSPALWAMGINSKADDFIKRLSGVSISSSRLKSIGSTQSPEIMRSIFRSAKNRTYFALWWKHTQGSWAQQWVASPNTSAF
jgi:hypothetical protein